DRLVRRLAALAGLAALRQHAGRTARMAAALAAALAAAHRMIDRVLRRAAIVRLAAHPAATAGLAEPNVHVVRVADHADRRPAIGAHAADLARRQRDLRPVSFTRGQGRRATGAPANLPPLARLHLDVVHVHAERNLPHRHAVAHARLDLLAADDA